MGCRLDSDNEECRVIYIQIFRGNGVSAENLWRSWRKSRVFQSSPDFPISISGRTEFGCTVGKSFFLVQVHGQ